MIEYASAGFFDDHEIIKNILDIHSLPDPRILDVTHNSGKMWKGVEAPITRSDINQNYNLDVVSDFKFIPFKDKSFEAIVFDPPHLVHTDTENSSNIWKDQYGLSAEYFNKEDDNIVSMFYPFLSEAKRVLVKNGLVLCKLTDFIHNHKYQWQHVAFINEVNSLGMTPCDLVVKIRNTKLISSKWINIHHFRRNHSYWIVVRNSNKCERP
jgi:tRNA G10  N-methylase Trm11